MSKAEIKNVKFIPEELRAKIINKLIEAEINDESWGNSFERILRDGIRGFNSFSDEELIDTMMDYLP